MNDAAVFVTGASGFLGAALLERLAERGARIHALARPTADLARLDHLDVRWHPGDLEDGASLEAAFQTFARETAGRRRLAIHGAARIGYARRDRERMQAVNVEGTERTLQAARHGELDRLVLVSSVVAVGHARNANEVLDEEAPFRGFELDVGYVTTKRRAEELALAREERFELVVACPGAIFGPSARPSNTAHLLRAVGEGTLGPLAPPGSLSVVGLGDAAEGVLLALERGRPGRRYLLCESTWTHFELLRFIARRLGTRSPRWAVPAPLWRLLVASASAIELFRPFELATPEALRLLGVHYRFDARRAREELGWCPRPFGEVLDACIADLSRRGVMPRRPSRRGSASVG